MGTAARTLAGTVAAGGTRALAAEDGLGVHVPAPKPSSWSSSSAKSLRLSARRCPGLSAGAVGLIALGVSFVTLPMAELPGEMGCDSMKRFVDPSLVSVGLTRLPSTGRGNLLPDDGEGGDLVCAAVAPS